MLAGSLEGLQEKHKSDCDVQGSLAQNSIRWSAFEDQTEAAWHRDISTALTGSSIRAKRIQEWNAEWERFCEWVVAEFGNSL